MIRDPGKSSRSVGERALLGAGAGLAILSFAASALLLVQRASLVQGLARSGRYDRFLALSLDALPPGLFALGALVSAWTLLAWRRPAARRSLAFLLLCVAAAGVWSMRSEGSRNASWPLIMADDFPSYYFAARALGEGQSPYDDHQARARRVLGEDLAAMHARNGLPAPRRPLTRAVFPYLYPPFTASLLAPFAGLSYFTAQHLWSVLQLGALALLLTLSGARSERAGPLFATAALMLLAYEPFVNNAETGQINILVALLAWLAFASDRGGRSLVAGTALALAIQLKGAPLLLLAYFLARGRWKSVCACAAALLALMGLTWAVDGGAMVGRFSSEIAPNISHVTKLALPEGLRPEALVLSNSPDPVRTFQDYPAVRVYNQAPVAFMGMVFTSLEGSGAAAVRVTQLLLALLWGATLWLAWRSRGRGAPLVFAAATVLVLLSSPLLWQHHLVWMIAPALALVAAGRPQGSAAWCGRLLAALGYLLSAHDLGYRALGLVGDLASVTEVLPWSYLQLLGLLLIWAGLFVSALRPATARSDPADPRRPRRAPAPASN